MIARNEQTPRPHGWEFIDVAALGVNSAASYAAAALIIIVCPLAVAVLLGVGSALLRDQPGSTAPIAAAIQQYVPIIAAGAAVLYCTVHMHRRRWISLIAPDLRIDWRRLAIGGGVELALLGGQLGLVHALVGWPFAFSALAALPLIALGLVLVPLQAASEEVLFRGYLTQALGRVVRGRIAIALTVGLVFGVLHLNAYGPLTVLYFLVVSLIFSLVSLRDDRLELAIGGHAAMNLFGFTTASTIAVEPGLIGAGSSGLAFNWAAVVVVMINGALFYGLTRLLVDRFCAPRSRR